MMRDFEEIRSLLCGVAIGLRAVDIDYARICDRAADAIEELLAAVPKWVSVEDDLPETGKVVLLCINCEEARPHTGFLTADGCFMHDVLGDMCRSKWKVTHWTPLPEPPKEDAE